MTFLYMSYRIHFGFFLNTATGHIGYFYGVKYKSFSNLVLSPGSISNSHILHLVTKMLQIIGFQTFICKLSKFSYTQPILNHLQINDTFSQLLALNLSYFGHIVLKIPSLAKNVITFLGFHF